MSRLDEIQDRANIIEDGWDAWYGDQETINALHALIEVDVPGLLARLRTLEAGLRGLEWGCQDDSGNPNYASCQVCGWFRVAGHMEGCALVPLLAALAGES